MKVYGREVAVSITIDAALLAVVQKWVKEKQFTDVERALRSAGGSLFSVFNHFSDTDIDTALTEATLAKSPTATLEAFVEKTPPPPPVVIAPITRAVIPAADFGLGADDAEAQKKAAVDALTAKLNAGATPGETETKPAESSATTTSNEPPA